MICVRTVSLTLLLALALPSLAAEAETLNGPGLREPVEIIKDRWGISHIYARSQHDLFYAQGFNAARDRLFQFEIWRRRALGTLAEVQGEKALAHDRGARLLRFRGDMAHELAHYHEDGAEIITAFVDGVNAYIDLVIAEPERLPFEFGLLGILPGKWTPEVVVSRHNALTGGVSTELMLAQTIAAIGPELTEQILPFERKPHLEPAPGVDLAWFSDDIMADYVASRNMPAFDAKDVGSVAADAEALSTNELTEWLFDPLTTSLGSNNWVIAGSKTASGKPLMANDPHRSIQNPSLRYIVHLNAPGWNVIGAGEPVLPGVSIGHNEHGAWGLTIFRIDQEDLYVYETNPANPSQYRYQGEWHDMEAETQTMAVRGQPDVEVTLKYTRHGPVLYEDPANNRAFAMRATWLETGSAPYLASLRMDQARSWEEFRAACGYSGLPGENMVWADRDGNIGWQAVGFTPIRIGWSGRLPVPGNGDYEWHGLVPITSMPHLLNPETGWYGTANHNNVPKGYPNIFSDFYSDPARAARLKEVLNASTKHSIEDSRRLQYDNKSMTAEVIVPVIAEIRMPRRLRPAVSLLSSWDYRLDRDSSAAALFDRWEQNMLAELGRRLLPDVRGANIARPKLMEWMRRPPTFVFGPSPEKERDRLVAEQLELAVASLRAAWGEEMSGWRYGDIHFTEIVHAMAHLESDALPPRLRIGPLPRGGGGNTLNANHGATRQTSGASFRMIVDTGDWDAAVGTNTPGQSGDPTSPHYADLFEPWNRGEYFPMLFSREEIEKAAGQVTRLVP